MNFTGATPARLAIALAMAIVLGVPLALRPAREARAPEGAGGAGGAGGVGGKLVIITPHNEQIRFEFERAFSDWRKARGEPPVALDWRVPGGTSEIRRIILDQYSKALATGRITPEGDLRPGAEPMPFDLFFGGGSFEHSQMKKGVTLRIPSQTANSEAREVSMPVSIPMGFDTGLLTRWFGANTIGSGFLYDPDQYWIGTALSGFGIVYNRDILRELGLPEPTSWIDMTHPRLAGWVSMADPRLSGSVSTTYDSILNNLGWDKGWRVLRAMCANSTTFTNNATKIPIDVSQGEAAVGVSIDFYGRYQAQAVQRQGENSDSSRVGYIDPPGVVYIDADPITLLRGASNPALARAFVEFALSDQAQALWQFRARENPEAERGAGTPVPPDRLGPTRYELRRMPIRRDFYARFADRMIDRVDPFAAASTVREQGWRSGIGPMMGAFAIDIHADQVRAWQAMRDAQERGLGAEVLAEMDRLFYAFPSHTMPSGETLPFSPETFRAIKAEWDRAGQEGRPTRSAMFTEYTRFFRENYRRIVRLAHENR